MPKFTITLRSSEVANGEQIYRDLKRELLSEGFEIDSAVESESSGITGSEIAITTIISFGASVAANLLHPKIVAAIERVRSRRQILMIEIIEDKQEAGNEKTPR